MQISRPIKNISLLIMLLVSFMGLAQQRAQYTQYILNNYVLNPASGGVNDYWDLKTGYRYQWAGFEGSPQTFFVSANGPIGYPHKKIRNGHLKPHHGVGGYAFHDNTGPLSMTGLYGSYSYHLKVNENFTASMGAFLGFMQYQIDGKQLVFVQNPDDPYITKSTLNYYVPDATVGIWLYNQSTYFGISANQIFQHKLRFDVNNVDAGHLNYHYFITGGHKFKMNQDFDFIPSVMTKYVMNSPLQFDLNARVKFRNMAWAGLSFRRQDAVAMLLGVVLNGRYEIGYSYDLTTSKLKQASWGSHEIIVGINFSKKGKVLCPSDFWN